MVSKNGDSVIFRPFEAHATCDEPGRSTFERAPSLGPPINRRTKRARKGLACPSLRGDCAGLRTGEIRCNNANGSQVCP